MPATEAKSRLPSGVQHHRYVLTSKGDVSVVERVLGVADRYYAIGRGLTRDMVVVG